MNSFEYTSPTAREQVAPLLGSDGAILAGGTDLLALMKDEIVQPKRLVNIKHVQTLSALRHAPSGVQIGALMKLQDLADNAIIGKNYPALAEALNDAASPQIRNMATLGGNLLQRPRCWYFRGGFGLLAMKDGKSLVLQGDNRYHAILGNEGPAYFVSPSTIAPVLIAYGAKVSILGADGKDRLIDLARLYRIPSSEGESEHSIGPQELLTEIVLPAAAGAKAGVYEVRPKHAFDWPLATAAVVLEMSGNTVRNARVVLGNVAPVPWISKEAEEALAGKPLNADTAELASAAAVKNAKSLGQNSHKIRDAQVAVKRAVLKAAGQQVV